MHDQTNNIIRAHKKLRVDKNCSVRYIRYLVPLLCTLSNSTLYWPYQQFYIIILLIAFVQGSIINYSRYIVRGVSYLSHLLLEESKICTHTSDISVLPKI